MKLDDLCYTEYMKKRIIIIGGGIVGATAAFYLSQSSNNDITVIDKASGTATRAAAGIICPWLSQRRNQHWYQLTSKGANFYLKLMDDLLAAERFDLPYHRTGTLVFKNKAALLEKLYQLAILRRQDAPAIGDISILQGEDLQKCIPEMQTSQGAVLASGGARVDGAKLLDILHMAIQENGGKWIVGTATIQPNQTVQIEQETLQYDQLILASGAWLPEVLAPLHYQVDIRPQKGQLLEVQTDFDTDKWPGCMLHGEIDILPFDHGKLVIGATHEDDMGYDLTIDQDKIAAMKKTASLFLPKLDGLAISGLRVGTRAYTSDYLPFYGNLAESPDIWVASGLGSSGLTSGPFIGWQIAQEINGCPTYFDRTPYSPDNYIKKR